MTEEERNRAQEEARRKHAKTKKIFKIVGIIMMVIGIGCIIVGFIDFFTSVSDFGMPKNFWLLFIGFPCTAIGGMLTLMGFRKEIMNYSMRESTPVFNEAGKQMQPGISAIASAVKNSDNVVCPACGTENDKDSAFCKKCGAALSKKCPVCGAELDHDAAFCDKCGKKLDDGNNF